MPRGWYDYFGNALPEEPTEEDIAKRDFNLRIMADKKPYFMCYIYPSLMTKYKDYIRAAERKCLFQFGIPIQSLLSMDADDMTEEQVSFVTYYYSRMPVSNNNCVMNRICRKIESLFPSGAQFAGIERPFDYSILKSNTHYTKHHYYAVKELYDEYMARLQEAASQARRQRKDSSARAMEKENFLREFVESVEAACSNSKELCDIVLDICYRKEGTKQFAWDVCGRQILANLLEHTDGVIRYPIVDPDGDFEYGGNRFSMFRKESTEWAKSL